MNLKDNSTIVSKYDLRGELERNICTIEGLEEYLRLTDEEKREIADIIRLHPMSISRYYMSLIDPNDPNDPLKKIAIPSTDEFSQGGLYDTSGERDNTKSVGLQHKYRQTALILLTHRCSVYCRFCFRKRMVGRTESEIISNIKAAEVYIRDHEEITNVLLSGGDPLVLENHIIDKFLDTFMNIDHIRFVRIGSRMPVVMPERIYGDGELQDILRKYSTPDKRVHIVTHFNHPNEINEHSCKAVDTFLKCGVPVHNQTVLLGGVNDDPNVLADLQRKLVMIGVNPYYVFQCRPVRRALHFQLPISQGYDIVEEAKKQLCGLAKRFKYVMSHKSGKIEIVAKDEDYLYFKRHQAKDTDELGKFFKLPLKEDAKWLDDLIE